MITIRDIQLPGAKIRSSAMYAKATSPMMAMARQGIEPILSRRSGRGLQKLVEEEEIFARDRGPGELVVHARAGRIGDFLALFGAVEQATQRVGPGDFVALGNDHAGRLNDVRNLAAIRADNRDTTGEGFDQHAA